MPSNPTFSLGSLYVTRAALEILSTSDVAEALTRHALGDWGEVCADDARLNVEATRDGSRILSAYRSVTGERFWVVTEADRSATTVLLPSDY